MLKMKRVFKSAVVARISLWAFLVLCFSSTMAHALYLVPKNCAGLLKNTDLHTSTGVYANRELRPRATIKSLKILSHNVENIYKSVGRFQRVSATQFEKIEDRYGEQKSTEMTKWLARLVIESSPDIWTVAEVESFEAAHRFNREELENQYDVFVFEGNDPRGLKIAFLIKKDLPFRLELRTHRENLYYDSVDRRLVPVFTRDLPMAIFRNIETDEVELVLLGMHAKSKRSRPGDPTSVRMRTAQYEATVGIIRSVYRELGDETPLILSGDFNADTRSSPEMNVIRESLSSAFDFARDSVAASERITHSFHHEQTNVYAQLDDFFISHSLRDRILRAQVLPFVTESGVRLKRAESFDERRRQPSDHYPIFMELSL
jgi:endonuclease/exonuclease/phosphatase (EEP) superfamily protein YafD